MNISIDKIKKIIFSVIDVSEFPDTIVKQRAMEIFREDGEKIIIILEGENIEIQGGASEKRDS